MAKGIISINNHSSSGGGGAIEPILVTKNSNKSGHTGNSSSSTSASIVLPANGTYILSCVITQSSADGYANNTSLNVGAWSYSGTLDSNSEIFNDSVDRYDNIDQGVHGGRARSYTEQRLVTAGSTNITATRNASCSGWGGNILVEVSAIKLG